MERHTDIRIKNISINNVKNVSDGSVSMDLDAVDEESGGASIIGLYGQNGSGKTALIWTFEMIKKAISGEKLPEDTYYYINQLSDYCYIKAEFQIVLDGRPYNVFYIISVKKTENYGFEIIEESVEYSSSAWMEKPKINKSKIISVKNVNSQSIGSCCYCPDSRVSELAGFDKSVKQKMIVQQVTSRERGISFIFNECILGLKFADEICSRILGELLVYARMNLFVLNKNSETSFNMNLLPLSVRVAGDNAVFKSDNFFVGLGVNSLDENSYKIITQTIEQINTLLAAVIPDLSIAASNVYESLGKMAEKRINFELVSVRDNITTPLRYESEGIKKIVCILSSLIAMFNNHSIFVAIDELDAGVFEYLLGEILRTISENGKGQLFFTSHNLRPLEVLKNENIWFTTVNSENKYIQFTGVKANNNLRNMLFRTIDLGGQKEEIYRGTSQYKIAKAFRKSGGAVK